MSLIGIYDGSCGLTPDYVPAKLEEFRENFYHSVRDSRLMLEKYPDLFRAKAANAG